MIVTKLEVSNLRGLRQREFTFDSSFNVLAGINGIGKTTILECLAVLLSRVIPRFAPTASGYLQFAQTDVLFASEALTARLWMECKRLPLEYSIVWNAQGGFIETPPSRETLRELKRQIAVTDERSTLGAPIAAFYTTDRAGFRLPKSPPKNVPVGRAAAYQGALQQKMVNYRTFMAWYRVRKRLDEERRRESPNTPVDLVVKTVETAIGKFLPDFNNLDVQDETFRLVVLKRDTPLFLGQLSDGERGFLAMIVDLAKRIALANPGSENPLEDGEGVVLIDELELHLHPSWQRSVINKLRKTFPKLQFITTTHSPFVIQALEPGQLINFDPATFAAEYADKSIEDITETVMGVVLPQKSERYMQMIETAERYFRLLRRPRPGTEAELAELRSDLDRLAEPFSDDPAYVALLRVERETALGGQQNAPGR